MNTKSLCQIATLAVSIPAGMALRGAMRANEHNTQKKLNPSSEGYKPPIYSAIFGAVLGMVIQTVPYCAIQVIRTRVHDRVEQNGLYGKVTVTHVYASDYQPQSTLEELSNFTTARGLYTLATESFTVPKTIVQFKTAHNNESVRLLQTYKGFVSPANVQFVSPQITTTKEQLTDADKANLITVANYSLAK